MLFLKPGVKKKIENSFFHCLLLLDLLLTASKLKFKRICMESSEQNWANISETICPEMLVFGK